MKNNKNAAVTVKVTPTATASTVATTVETKEQEATVETTEVVTATPVEAKIQPEEKVESEVLTAKVKNQTEEKVEEQTVVARTTGPVEIKKPEAKRRSHCTTVPKGHAPDWNVILKQAAEKLGIFDELGNATGKYKIIFETEPVNEKAKSKNSSIRTIVASDNDNEKGLVPPAIASILADAVKAGDDNTYNEADVVDPATVAQN